MNPELEKAAHQALQEIYDKQVLGKIKERLREAVSLAKELRKLAEKQPRKSTTEGYGSS